MKTLYLVTGAAGYLGGEVCRQLVERGLHGRALVLPGDKTAQYIPREIEQCEGDLCDTASLERFFSVAPDTETIVLHCASMVALGNERRELVMKVNVQGTQNIIDQCFARLECKKLVYVGSTGAIQELPHGQRMKESECFVPEESFDVYGQSKAMASQLVLDAAKAGLNACIVMPSGILGPGNAACGPVTSGLLMQMRGKVSVGLKGTFNLCDVRDLANGLFLAVEKGKAGESYILANEIVTYPEFAALTAQEGHCKKPLFYLPKGIANLAADILERQAKKSGKKPALTRYEIYNLARNNEYDSTKARRELGYTSRPYRETIHDEIVWLKKNHKI